MTRKKGKKKNYKLRKQIRRTLGALLMISAIIVAAVPVPDLSANPTEPAYVKVKVSHQDEHGEPAQDGDKKLYVSEIPYVPVDSQIYTTGDGMFQFAYVSPKSGGDNKIAVILGYEGTYLAGGSLTIPNQVDGYRQLKDNASRSGYCAVSKNDHFLYYKEEVTRQKRDPDTGELMYETDVVDEINLDGTRTSQTIEHRDQPIMETVVTYAPCYYASYAKWKDIKDEDLYYFDPAETDPDQQYKSCSGDYLRLRDATVAYIGNQKLAPKTEADGTNGWKVESGLIVSPEDGVFAGNKGKNIVTLDIGSDLRGIGEYAFYGCSSLTKVSLGNGVQSIGNGAFAECIRMMECKIDSNARLGVIGKDAFYDCRSLKSFSVPIGLDAIGDYCFQNCTSLISIDLTAGGGEVALSAIGEDAFVNCVSLENISFPGSYDETLDIKIFKGCESLQWIRTPNKTMTFTATGGFSFSDFIQQMKDHYGRDSFYFEAYGDAALHGVATDNAIAFRYLGEDKYEKVIKDSEGHAVKWLVNSQNTLLSVEIDKEVTDIVIPDSIGPYGIHNIDSNSFSGNCYLEKLTIPSSVQSISANAFRGCHQLRDVIFVEPVQITSIGADAFATQKVDFHRSDCPFGSSSTLPISPVLTFTGPIGYEIEPYKYAMNPNSNFNNGSQEKSYITYYSGWPTNLEVKYNPDTGKKELKSYPRYADLRNGALDSYPYMTAEYKQAAREAVQVYEASQSPSYTGDMPTQNQMDIVNSALNMNLPAGVEAIKTGIFSGLDTNGASIGGSSGGGGTPTPSPARFSLWSSPTSPTTTLPNTDLKTITMNSVAEIEPYTFAGGTGLTGFYMNSTGVETGEKIGNYSFQGCEKLENISFPSTTTSVGLRPFKDCGKNLPTAVNFNGSSNFVCEEGVIYGLKDNAKDRIIECLESRGNAVGAAKISAQETAGVTSIQDEAFQNCDYIGTVELSSSKVKIIPARCFAETDDLYEVDLPNKTTQILADSFKNSNVRVVKIPNNLVQIAQDAFKSETNPSKKVTFLCDEENSSASDYADLYDYIVVSNEVTPQQWDVFFWDNFDTANPKLIKETAVNNGEAAVPPADEEIPAHEGYDFAGWQGNFDAIYRSTDIYAKYVPKGVVTHTVTFLNSIDDSKIDEQTVEDGKDAKAPDAPAMDGYKFKEWKPAFTNVKTDLTVYAFYDSVNPEVKTYTVTFWTDDGTVIGKPQQIPEGGDAVAPQVPEREGYKFKNWAPATFTNIKKDMDIIAIYEKVDSSGNGSNNGNNNNDNNNSDNNNNGNNNNGNNSSGSNNNDNNNNSSNTASGNSVSDNDVKYTLVVAGGSGSGTYKPGTVVTINAFATGDDKVFDRWTTSTAGVAFVDPTAISTSFTMPADNVAVSATYKTPEGEPAAPPAAGTAVTPAPSGGEDTGTTVDVDKDGISNEELAAATVDGSSDNFVVKVTEDAYASNEVLKALQNEYGDMTNIKYLPMDISLYDSTGQTKITDTAGLSVEITLPLPDELVEYAGNNKVAGVVDGKLDKMDSRFTTINGVPCMNFTATHLSPYTIYVDTGNLTAGTADATPKTGDPIHPKWFLAVGLACLSVVLFCKKDRLPGASVKQA